MAGPDTCFPTIGVALSATRFAASTNSSIGPMSVPPPGKPKTITDLLAVMAALRDRETGCPWDVEQTFETIAPYTIEEAYEVADAIERGDREDLRDELGDLLLQVVYHARMAEEEGAFDFADVVTGICDKMVRRHPHVFGDATARSSVELEGLWERIKAEEKADRGETENEGALGAVPVALPALARAAALQAKAAKVRFDWPGVHPVLAKAKEELAELEAEIGGETVDRARAAEELGDLMFVLANLARHLKADPEATLRAANAKFVRRFEAVEAMARAEGRQPGDCDLDELDGYWERVKAGETTPDKKP